MILTSGTQTSYRFTSPSDTGTNPFFVGAGYDWSGVASSSQISALISPITTYSAQHFSPSIGQGAAYYNPLTNALESGTVASHANPIGDVGINTLTQAYTAAQDIAVLRILDISSQNYVGLPLFMVGADHTNGYAQEVGTDMVNNVWLTGDSDACDLISDTYYDNPSLTFEYWEGGDSGSSMLIPYKGQLTIAGAAHYASGSGSTLLSIPGYDPVTPTDAIMAPTGYALRFTIYDVPTDTANTANVWTGAAGTGAFGTAANWSLSVVPSNLPVVFDSSATNGQSSINLGTNQQLRGILFRRDTTALLTGVTFNAGSSLSIGEDGIRNEDSYTQTFNSNILLTACQNWEAVNGNLAFNGNIANNGNLLVVQGAKNTTISGVISGAGGLAKDDAGTLILDGSNTYAGTTFLHNGELMLGTINALPSNTIVRFDTGNPTTFDVNGETQTIGDLRSVNNGTGIVAVNGGSLFAGADNQSSTYSGVFTGSGLITKVGSGTWTLTGKSTGYNGSVADSGGTLQLDSSVGTAGVTVNAGATLTGTGSIVGGITLNAGSLLTPGISGIGALTDQGGLDWNGGGSLLFSLGAPGTSTFLNLGSSALTKGSFGSYAFTFLNGGGMATGLYTLMDFGSTTFNVSDFGFTNQNGFSGNFLLESGSLQFQVNNIGTVTGPTGWNNFSALTPVYETTANWINGTINSQFTENIQSGFTQVVQFQKSEALSGPLTINFNSTDIAPGGGSPVATKGWFFLSQTTTLSTLTLGGNIQVNDAFNLVNPLLPTIIPNISVGTTVVLGGGNGSVAGAGYNLAAIDLGGANRTISTDMPTDYLYSLYGFFIEAPITDASNSGASLTKTGNGNVVLGATNTFTGNLNIQNGTVSLIGNGTLASKNITVSGGGELYISNVSRDDYSGTVNNPNRLTASGGPNLNVQGADIEFAGTAGQTLTFKSVNATQGLSIFHPYSNSGADDTIAMTALNRSEGATIFLPYLAATGSTGNNGAYVTTSTINGSAPAAGTIIPWAFAGYGNNGLYYTGFVVYNNTYGFQPESAPYADANYLAGTNFSSASAATDYQLNSTYALTANTTVNSLVTATNSSVTITSGAGGPFTLKMGSGGLIIGNGATIGSATATNNVTLDFNHNEGIIAASANDAKLLSPISNANGLTITASPPYGYSSVYLNFANPFNSDSSQTAYNWGPTFLNAGRLAIQNASALPNTGDLTVNISTETVGPYANAVTITPAVVDLYGNTITIGGLNGAGMVVLDSMIASRSPSGIISGTLTLGNGGDSGSFSGEVMNTLLPLLPYGTSQGNQISTYGAVANIISLGVAKTGTGTETFSGDNIYTGSTAITGGTLALTGSGTLGVNSAVTLTGAGSTLDLSASTIFPAIGSLSGSAGTVVNTGTNILSFGGNDMPTLFSGNINGAGGGILKTGAGMTILNGVDTYTGSTTVSSGILQINHGSTNASMLGASKPLVMAGGALQIVGNGQTTDTAGGLTVSPGASAIQVYNNPLGATATLAVGAITRAAGGTVDFTSIGGRITTTTTNGTILGGWATANGASDWAAVNSGVIVSASSIAGAETVANNVSTWGTGTANVVSGAPGFSGTTASGSTVNSVLFQGAASSNINIADLLTVNSGGILETAAVGNNPSAINGGVLQSGNGQDLVIIQNNTAASLTIGSTIFGMNGLTKSGAGLLVISGNDVHYGPTVVNAGDLALLGSSTTLGSNSALTVASGAIVDLSQSAAAQNFVSVAGAGNIFMGSGGITLGSDGSSSSFSGAISGSGGITKNGAGTLTLSGMDTYTGPLMINLGTVAVTGDGILGNNSDVIIAAASSGAATLDLSGAASAISIGSLSGAGNLMLSPVGMTIGADNTSTTFSGIIAGIGGFTKVGAGTLTLTGTNVSVPDVQYGTTTVNSEAIDGGTLLLDFRGNTASKVNIGSNVIMGGGTLAGIGNATTNTTQNTGYYFYVYPGASSVYASTPSGGTASFTLGLTNLNRTAGGTVDFTASSGGGVASITTNSGLTNGILGGFATVNGMSDWAMETSKVIGAVTPSVAGTSTATALYTYTGGTVYSGDQYIFGLSSTAGLAVGQGVIGPGVPAGATIISVSGGLVELSVTANASDSSNSYTFDGVTVSSTSQLAIGQALIGANIPAGATVASIIGNVISLSAAPTGTVGAFATSGYARGTANDQGATIATLDNPANWTAANYGDANLGKANVTDDSAGFSGTLGASVTINSLRINAAVSGNIGIASGQTLTLASGGLLETAAVGANPVNISGGTLSTGNSADLIFIQNNTAASLTVSSAIASGNGVTKSGSGALILAGNNTYTGPTTVNSGTLALGGASTVGNGSAVTVMPGATLDLRSSTASTQSFGSLSSISTAGGVGGGNVILGSSISTLTVGSNNASTVFSGVIQDGVGSAAGLTKSGTGVLTLGGSNTYTGGTYINAGTLLLGNGGFIAGSVNVGNGSAVAMLAGSGEVGNVSVDSTSTTKYGILEPGTPAVGPFTIQTAGLLTTNSLSLAGTNTHVNFLLGSPAVPGSTYSTVDVDGNLTLAGAVLNITALAAFGPGTYDLFTYTGTESGTLTLGSVPAGYSASQFSFSYGGNHVVLTTSPSQAVPEPGVPAILMGGILLLALAKLRASRSRRLANQ